MRRKKQFIHLLLIAGLLFVTVIACVKTNNLGGNVQSAGKLKDADGNVYKTVKIGSQVWMAENLKTTRYNDGTEISNVTGDTQWANLTTGAWCNYDNQESNAATYGRLYNWYAVNTGKLAPVGWHVPTDEEWTTLENYVAANTGTSGSQAKALASAINWASSTVNGVIGNDLTKNNSAGFSALPGGYRYDSGGFNGIASYGDWWSSTEHSASNAWHRYLGYGDSNVYRGLNYKEYGFSVRCVRDN